MRTVFLDTVGLIATWDEDDQWHALAEPVFRALAQQRLLLVRTPLVLYECGNTAARKTYRSDVAAFRRELAANVPGFSANLSSAFKPIKISVRAKHTGGRAMPRRKRPNPAATYGWEGEVRQENIDSAVGSYLRAHGPRTYREAYDIAKRMVGEGKQHGEIRETLRRAPHKQEYSAEDSPQRADQKEIGNSVERYLCDAARQGIEDALAGRAPNYKSPPGY